MTRPPDLLQSKERRVLILAYLREYAKRHGYSPSIREICIHTGISSTSVVAFHLRRLEELGHIRRDPKIARAISFPFPVAEKEASHEKQ